MPSPPWLAQMAYLFGSCGSASMPRPNGAANSGVAISASTPAVSSTAWMRFRYGSSGARPRASIAASSIQLAYMSPTLAAVVPAAGVCAARPSTTALTSRSDFSPRASKEPYRALSAGMVNVASHLPLAYRKKSSPGWTAVSMLAVSTPNEPSAASGAAAVAGLDGAGALPEQPTSTDSEAARRTRVMKAPLCVGPRGRHCCRPTNQDTADRLATGYDAGSRGTAHVMVNGA